VHREYAAEGAVVTPEQIESLVKEIDPKAKLEGDELVLLNPQRRDRTRKSFKINRVSGIWKDFAAGKGGADVVGFWAYCKGIPYDQAAKELALRFGTEAPKSHEQPKDNLLFIPMHEIEGYQAPMRGRAKPSKVWTYCDQQGRPLFQRPRWDFVKADGKADKVVTWWGVFEDAKGKLEWMQKAPPTPRPLYGLPDLQDPKRDQGVLVVEGEKTADAARALFSKLAIVTSGASDSAKTTDWSPLAGRDVVLWPDHDQPGLDYAEAVAAQLKPLGVELRVVDVPNFFPQKWDLADPLPNGATRDTLVEMIDHAQLQSVVEPVTITHRLEARTWNDFQSRTFTEQEWLCEPLFPKVSIGLVASGPGHGKTTTMIQLAVSLATGLPFMGMPVCGPCGIGLLLLEDNENLIHGRLQAQVTRYGDAITAEHGAEAGVITLRHRPSSAASS
jgi:hypothetical protein